MNESRLRRAILPMLLTLAAGPASAEQVVDADRLDDTLLVREVRLVGDEVRGVLVNNSAQRIEDLQLRVTWHWLWKDEFRPGSEGAGWVATVPFAESLHPGERCDFKIAADRPLPDRDDGRVMPSVSVASFTAYTGEAVP